MRTLTRGTCDINRARAEVQNLRHELAALQAQLGTIPEAEEDTPETQARHMAYHPTRHVLVTSSPQARRLSL